MLLQFRHIDAVKIIVQEYHADINQRFTSVDPLIDLHERRLSHVHALHLLILPVAVSEPIVPVKMEVIVSQLDSFLDIGGGIDVNAQDDMVMRRRTCLIHFPRY
jgi:hypothetical protein